MRRLPTALALGAWLGFLVTTVMQHATGTGGNFRHSATTADLSAPLTRIDLPSFGLLAAAALMLAALLLLNEQRTDRRQLGEGLGCAGLGIVALLAAAPGLNSAMAFAGSFGFWAAMAATLGAIAFDHLITDEAPDDEAEFRAGIAVIAGAMARQTHLYAERSGENRDGSKR